MSDAQRLRDLAARVEALTDRCWPWPRKLDATGRGRIWWNGRLMLAHRFMWTVLRGQIPDGRILCHTCDNPACVNPSHLYAGTHADNMRDMRERGRSMAKRHPELARALGVAAGRANTWSRGAGNPKARLTAEQASAIRMDKRPTRLVAAEYGVERTTIQRIRRGTLWTA